MSDEAAVQNGSAMRSFVRFTLFVLVVGVVVNFTIVVLANARSQREQAAGVAAERERFTQLVEAVSDRLRRAHVAVAWQKTDAKNEVLRTSLLVRQYGLSAGEGATPLPLAEFEIPGHRVYVDGLKLEFNALFAEDAPDFQVLRNRTLLYFGHVYGEGQVKEDRFSLVNSPYVPETTRLHPDRAFPTLFEMRLWQHLWNLINVPEMAERRGLKVTWVKEAGRAVRVGKVYVAYLGKDGMTLEEDDTPGLLAGMLKEAEEMKTAE